MPGREMEDALVLEMSRQMAVMSSQLDGLLTSVGEIKADVRNLSDEAPIHRIAELERWRDEAKKQIGGVPELVRWKGNISTAMRSLTVGLVLAFAAAVFAIILAR